MLSLIFEHPFISIGLAGLSYVVGFLYMNQRSLIYPSNVPEGSRQEVAEPKDVGLEGSAEVIWIQNKKDGVDLHAYFVRDNDVNVRKKKHTVVYCHANAGNMGHRLPIVKRLYELFSCNILIFSYRGYGKSGGEAHELGMKSDAESVVEWLFSRDDVDSGKLVLFGQSIGGAVAIHLASTFKKNFQALIVENTFLSIPKLIPHVMPVAKYFTFLCTEKWYSEDVILKCDTELPFLFLSSSNDELVPPEHQKLLFQRAPMKTKHFEVIHGGTHNDAVMFKEYWKALNDFWKTHISRENKL